MYAKQRERARLFVSHAISLTRDHVKWWERSMNYKFWRQISGNTDGSKGYFSSQRLSTYVTSKTGLNHRWCNEEKTTANQNHQDRKISVDKQKDKTKNFICKNCFDLNSQKTVENEGLIQAGRWSISSFCAISGRSKQWKIKWWDAFFFSHS